jgi:selenocysteine-specific elongation factor
MSSSTDHPIIVGTAGHIDHGKTALIKALTGIDTDRLKEEKERGITIELGFAHLDLDGRRLGVVDVPGHERFIKAMVAGAGGVDLAILVIAADEGIMPQTREHLDICGLLGVRTGVVALTKSDLVDADWLALVGDEVRGRLAGTFLHDAALIPVSARTGAGLDELRAEIARLAARIPARAADGAFRLPLDRVFTIKGFGTVVTGTILGGTVRTGDALLVHPRALEAKVRGLEVHGSPAEVARAGMRCAVNLTGVAREDLARGDVLAHPGGVAPSHILDVRFRYLASSRAPLPRRSRVLLHHGTTQLMASLVLVDHDELAPGAEGLAQLRLDATTPLAALPGDRFIARGFVVQEHYGTTLGGGEILRVLAPKARRQDGAADALARIAAARGDARVLLEVGGSGAAGLSAADLGRRLGIAPADLAASLQRLTEGGDLVAAGDLHLTAAELARLDKQAIDHLTAFHAANPHKEGMSREELRARLPRALPARFADLIVDGLVRRGTLEIDKDLVRRRRAAGAPASAASGLADTLAAKLAAWGLEAPRPKEMPELLKLPEPQIKAALDQLVAAKRAVKVKPDYIADRAAIDALRAKLLAHLDAHGTIDAQQWKDLCGTTRKWSIPLAEYFDAEKVTLRVGDLRKRRG